MSEQQTMPCNKCGTPINLEAPRLELINQLTISAIVWAHPDVVTCQQCGLVYVGIMPELQYNAIKLSYVPMPDGPPKGVAVKKEPTRIINPFK
jgi:hypothetical protein